MYKFKESTPRWIDFENKNGEKGKAGIANNRAKGHAWEHLDKGEEKVLCDFSGSGVVRRMWFTLSNRTLEALQNIDLIMCWDYAKTPQVCVPFADFFGFATGGVKAYENKLFTTAEGRSFTCLIPMPFKKHCKISLKNNGEYIKNLFYDIDLTAEEVSEEDMYFCAEFKDCVNELCSDVELLSFKKGSGRYLGTSFAVFPDNKQYPKLWWGEGEVKIYIDGDNEYPTLCGTGAEDYLGSAWELNEFVNSESGCLYKSEESLLMYRYHISDPIYFKNDIKVTLQAMGGGGAELVKSVIKNGYPCVPVTYDDGDVIPIYKTDFNYENLQGYVCFYRQDRYRITTYYYMK